MSTNQLNTPLSHTSAHIDLNDAVEALEAKVGIDDSTVATSLDFLLRQGMAFVGQTIEWNSVTDPPVGEWADEDGRPLSQTGYPVLFALLGNTWNNFRGLSSPALGFFRIPWSDGLVAVATGSPGFSPSTSARVLATAGGEEAATLVVDTIPAHQHLVDFNLRSFTAGGGDTFLELTNGGGGSGAVDSQPTGGDQAHENMQPFVVKRKIIRIA